MAAPEAIWVASTDVRLVAACPLLAVSIVAAAAAMPGFGRNCVAVWRRAGAGKPAR